MNGKQITMLVDALEEAKDRIGELDERAKAFAIIDVAVEYIADGYSADLVRTFVSNPSPVRLVGRKKEKEVVAPSEQDADSLFRALVLDEHVPVEAAEVIWSAAYLIVSEG